MPNGLGWAPTQSSAPTISPITCERATAWIVPPVRSPVASLLAELGSALDALGLPWYLFGAQAAIVYGVARLTADVDVTVYAADRATADWLGAVEQRGFQRRFDDAAFIAQTRVVPLVHLATGLPVDLVLAGPGLEEQFLQRREMHAVDDVRVPVISRQDLIVLKVLAGRSKDLDDVVMLLRIHSALAADAGVRSTLGLLEQALGQSDLLSTFETCLTRAST